MKGKGRDVFSLVVMILVGDLLLNLQMRNCHRAGLLQCWNQLE